MGKCRSIRVRKGWMAERGKTWSGVRGEGTFEETPLQGEAWEKSILSLQRKKFMKLEHKCGHVQLAALNLRGEAGEEVGGHMVIKTSEEANKACCWSMIPGSRFSHSLLGRFHSAHKHSALNNNLCAAYNSSTKGSIAFDIYTCLNTGHNTSPAWLSQS